MFRELRRKRQELSRGECEAMLQRGTSGVLALQGDGGYPYAVPLSYLYSEGEILFHCAKEGHKIDAIRRCPKASFCVVGKDEVVPEEYTTRFRSVIAFGTIRIIEDEKEMRDAITRLAVKYAPADSAENRGREIEKYWPALCMLSMRVEHISGKESLALAQGREARAPKEGGA